MLFSYNRMADPNHPFAKVTPGQTYAYFEDMGMKDIVDHVEKADALQVRLVLTKHEAPVLADMATDRARSPPPRGRPAGISRALSAA